MCQPVIRDAGSHNSQIVELLKRGGLCHMFVHHNALAEANEADRPIAIHLNVGRNSLQLIYCLRLVLRRLCTHQTYSAK